MDSNKKISYKQWAEFDRNYHRTKTLCTTVLRYGQAFCNHFNITDTRLFYMENNTLAAELCVEYIDWDKE